MAYSRAGTDPTLRTSVPLYGVLETVEETLSAEISEASVEILADTLPTVMGDRARITQLVRHLMDNAVKYNNGQRPMVRMSVERGPGEWVIAIEDNGIGIALEYQDQIFDMFQRLHLRDEYPGAGIGLAIAKRIVEGFGGRIWVESILGVGSTFYFTMPDIPGEQNEEAYRFGQAARGQSNPGLAG
jgi:light-regulated signal transduction histidine kinase (bacteriophytochrome)